MRRYLTQSNVTNEKKENKNQNWLGKQMVCCEGLSANFATIQNTLIVIEIVCRQPIDKQYSPKRFPKRYHDWTLF